MKKKNKVFIYLLLFSLIFGCKKQDSVKEITLQQNSVSEKAKSWIETQAAILSSPKFLLEGKVIDIPEKIDWEKSKYFPQSKISITPVRVTSVESDLLTYKYLVTEMNDAGEVIAANYYAVINDRQMMGSTEFYTITPELVNLQKMPGEFSGAIIKYDLSNKIVFTKHYEKGVLSNKTDKISIKKSKTIVPAQNYAPLPGNCSYVVIEWYYQVYVNGVLVYEEYIGNSVMVTCNEDGNGGGGGGGGGTLTCEQQMENFINQGIAFSGPVTQTDVSNTGIIWIKSYDWPIFKAATWGLFSFDKGTLEKIHYPNIDLWEFQSFQHLQIAEVGTVIGGTRTFLDLGAIINITPSKTSVWEQVNFSVSSKATCSPFNPVTLTYTSSKTFFAPNNIVIQGN